MTNAHERLVSVVVPAHNAGPWLEETLESLARQTYLNWELAVTEDGTDDGTRHLVAEFARRHAGHRISYLRHETPRGQGPARNSGIRATSGAFVAFLDADDLWTPEYLARAIRILEQGSADVFFCPYYDFEADPSQLTGPRGLDEARWGPLPDSLYVHCCLIPSALVVRRGVLEEIGLFDEDPRVQSGEDLELAVRLAGAGARFHHEASVRCLHRVHPAAVSRNKTRMAETKAWALFKNLHTIGSVPESFRRLRVGIVCEAAAMANRRTRPDRAAGYYLMAFRANPRRIKYPAYALACALFAACRGLFPPVIAEPSPWPRTALSGRR